MYPHDIRLAGPWEQVAVSNGSPRLRRRFGRPRNLDEWERVWLITTERPSEITVPWLLNGTELIWSQRGDGFLRSNVTEILRERNELLVEWGSPAGRESFKGAILEIGCRAYVEKVEFHSHPVNGGYSLSVEVRLLSESADDPLELYALIDGESYGYCGPLSLAGPVSHEFRLDERAFASGASVTLRIELICRSTVWDSREMSVTIPEA
jgi:hypothetical protein